MKKKNTLLLLVSFLALFGISAMLYAAPVGTCPKITTDFDVLLPDHENRTIFYKCDNGIPELVECPGGLHFNPCGDACDYPENVSRCYASYDNNIAD